MCSYNRVNNSYGCSNSKTLNGLLKTELGFQGFVVSDWGAQHAGVATANAGLDMYDRPFFSLLMGGLLLTFWAHRAMPIDDGQWGSSLVAAVKNGSVTEDRITDMATRWVI